MSAFDKLPIKETVAVFLAVSAFEWLSEGQAGVLKALACAVIVGPLIYFGRRYLTPHETQDTDCVSR